MSLLDLLDGWEEAPWVPLYKPFGVTLASLVVGSRCRDCGEALGHVTAEGSRSGVGIYSLCHDCSRIDECRPSTFLGEDIHVDRWGGWHHAAAHPGLLSAQADRRAQYLRKRAA